MKNRAVRKQFGSQKQSVKSSKSGKIVKNNKTIMTDVIDEGEESSSR